MMRLDERLPIKVIAKELGVSETRINQHIRALKDAYGVQNMNALILEYRRTKDPEEYPPLEVIEEDIARSSWFVTGPSLLSGRSAVFVRSAAIVIIAFGIIGVALLGMTAAKELSDTVGSIPTSLPS